MAMGREKGPSVGVVMGSESDSKVMELAQDTLSGLGISWERRVLSAHRTPDVMTEYAKTAYSRGIKVIIAAAGGAAHLPGMIAANEPRIPVIGVPILTSALQGVDSFLSIVQMPPGIPVGTVGIGRAENAGLLAAQILATSDIELADRLTKKRSELAEIVKGTDKELSKDNPK